MARRNRAVLDMLAAMMIGMMLAGLFSIAIGLLTIGLAANAVWRAVMAPPGTPRKAGCGACGYELTTLEGGRCSECGADLLKAGVPTRRQVIRVGGSLPAALMGWTILISTVGLTGFYLVFSLGVARATMTGLEGYTANFTFGPEQTFDAERGVFTGKADFRISVAVDVVGDWNGPADAGTIVAELEGADRAVTITWADASDPAWVMTDDAGSEIGSGPGFTLNDAVAAFDAVGIDASASPENLVYVTQCQTLLNAAYQDPFNFEYDLDIYEDDETRIERTGGGMTTNMAGMNPMLFGDRTTNIVAGMILGGGVLLWAVGCVLIVVRRSRLIASARV